MTSWKHYLARLALATVAIGGAVFVAIRAANAELGGHTRHALTVAGTLTGVTGTPTLAFTLRKGTATCPATARNVVLNGSTFTAEVPIDGCPAFFDGSDVTVDVSVNGTPVVNGGAVNPVPYARYADQYGTPDCPVGYTRVIDVAAGFLGGSSTPRRLCVQGNPSNAEDEVVRVGTGSSAFWIDRYEAQVYDRAGMVPSSLAGLTPSGQWLQTDQLPSYVARSRWGGGGPRVGITWFQASELCRAAGKRLPSRGEWIAAAAGTQDVPTNCNVSNMSGAVNNSPSRSCRSMWGAHEMIGNVAEWVDEWYSGVGATTGTAGNFVFVGVDQWGTGYSSDGTWNVNSWVARAGETVTAIPAAAIRGGSFNSGDRAGVFALDLRRSAAFSDSDLGFRCVIPR